MRRLTMYAPTNNDVPTKQLYTGQHIRGAHALFKA
jgi:hypothetical protein